MTGLAVQWGDPNRYQRCSVILVAEVPVAFKDLDWEGMDPPGPMTESAKESGFKRDVDDDELGYSDELQDDVTDNAGDIADEGPGHRA